MFVRPKFILAILLLGALSPGLVRAQGRSLEVSIRVEGEDSKRLKSLLETISELKQVRKDSVVSLGAVRRLAAGDSERFERALSSEGFYAATLDSDAEATDTGFRATFKVTTGARFKITVHAIEYIDSGLESRPKTAAETGAALNDSSRGPDILKVEKEFLTRLRATGYPLAHVVDRQAEVKAGSTDARLVYRVESGPRANFGETVWLGTKRTRTGYLDKFVTWKKGETYNLDRTNEMRDELSDSGLFTRIEIVPGPVGTEGNAPVMVDLTERKPRTIAAGVSYSTNLGAGFTASWVNRNLFGRGEKLSGDLKFAQVLQSSALGFEKPKILTRTDLVTKLTATHEDDDAFRGKSLVGAAALKHLFGKSLTASAGVELYSSTTIDPLDPLHHRHSYLVGFPIGGVWSSVKDVLDPKRGLSLALTIAPNVGQSNGPVFFTLAEITSNYHWAIDKNDKYIGALWTRVGAFVGPGVAAIPPGKRYYAGGAGSVRGYGYRLLGPTDAAGKPIGGRSVLEGGAELRFPVYKQFGGAVFVEAGGVDETGVFTFKQGMRESVGLGARYATGIGPIRVDLAVPLDRRRGIDAPLQIYVGLGQAF